MSVRRPTRLPRWQEWAVYLALGALVLTGLIWLALDSWIRIAGDFGPEHHPAQRGMLIAHGVAAYVFLAVAGMLFTVHVPLGWRMRRNRTSGGLLALILLILAASALALYYWGGEAARSWISLFHWLVGVGAAPMLAVHVLLGRRAARLKG